MSFFAEDPADRERVRPRLPEWMHPPEDVVPAGVPVETILVRNDRVALWVAELLAYPNGLAFGVVCVRRGDVEPAARPLPLFVDDRGPRFGVAFADGRRALAGRGRGGPKERDPATDALLSYVGGGGTERRMESHLWLWPLPPAGPLSFVFASEDDGLEERTVTIDATPAVEASRRATPIWER